MIGISNEYYILNTTFYGTPGKKEFIIGVDYQIMIFANNTLDNLISTGVFPFVSVQFSQLRCDNSYNYIEISGN